MKPEQQPPQPKNWQDTPQGKKLLRACAKNTAKLAQELKDVGGCVFDLSHGIPPSKGGQSNG